MLRLRAFGGLSLEHEGTPLRGAAAQRRRLSILAVLAVAGRRGASRDTLVGLLWPDVDEPRARSALSQSLYALKHDSGVDELVIGSETLSLNSAALTSDVADFEDALARNDLSHAAQLYAGTFLDGVHLSAASEFEHWLDDTRFRFGRAAERAIESLAVKAEEAKDYAAAAEWWRRLIAIDPLKTRGVIGLMSALAESGDRSGAIRHAERYEQHVRDDIDGEPSAAVMKYAERLRHDVHHERFASHFLLERELGRGGMAVVYLARDTKHDRHVALKMLHPEASAAIGRERLAQEIRVTASLQHPHILPLHDSGEWGDALYYVTPFVDGETLRARLDREPQLPADDVLKITQEIAEALAHAHRRGVVHRDIKPENILLAEQHAIVADFGIARLISDSLDARPTQSGAILGTPAYMSPEQMAGESEVGPPSDVFSLGCIVFEMLAGRPPWIAVTVPAVVALRLNQRAPSLRALRPEVPQWLDDLVGEMLALDSRHRPQTGSDVLRLLASGPITLPSQLPFVGDEIIGRQDELRSACSLLERADVSVLTLTGAGGTGKTRLAIAVARSLEARFDRVCFVDLAAVRESTNVMPAIVAATRAQLSNGGDEIEALAGALRGKRTLLVLDNFEQVVAAAPSIARFVAITPGLKLLITSRTRLGIRAEHELFVAPLVVPEHAASTPALRDNPAIQLFVRCALSINGALTFDDEMLAAAARICTRVDGLPLAIELAAARCRLMSPRTIATRIEKSFDVVSGGGRDVPARHQTIREAIEWSVELLKPSERRAFARMATFSGACTFAAAEFVCGGESSAAEVLDDLGALIDASVVMRETRTADGEPRLRMLETVRDVALGELASASQREIVADRHAEWYERLALSVASELTGEGQHHALETLAQDHANLAAAVEWTIQSDDTRRALSLGSALWRYWLVRGYLVEGRALLARVLGMAHANTSEIDVLRADVMSGAAHLAQNSGAVGDAESYFRAALDIRRRQADDAGIARALADLGWIAWRRCDFPTARRLSTECLTLAEAIGATRVAALALTNLGAASLFEGDYQAARRSLTRSVELRGQVGDRRGVAVANTFLAWTLCRAGSNDAALALLEDAERALHGLGDERLLYFVRDTRTEVVLRMGDAARAAILLDVESMKGGRRFGDRWSVARGLALASLALRLRGDCARAASFARESLELRRAEGDRHGEAESLWLLAAVARELGNDAEAHALILESRDIRSAIGDKAGVAICDAELASTESAQERASS